MRRGEWGGAPKVTSRRAPPSPGLWGSQTRRVTAVGEARPPPLLSGKMAPSERVRLPLSPAAAVAEGSPASVSRGWGEGTFRSDSATGGGLPHGLRSRPWGPSGVSSGWGVGPGPQRTSVGGPGGDPPPGSGPDANRNPGTKRGSGLRPGGPGAGPCWGRGVGGSASRRTGGGALLGAGRGGLRPGGPGAGPVLGRGLGVARGGVLAGGPSLSPDARAGDGWRRLRGRG